MWKHKTGLLCTKYLIKSKDIILWIWKVTEQSSRQKQIKSNLRKLRKYWGILSRSKLYIKATPVFLNILQLQQKKNMLLFRLTQKPTKKREESFFSFARVREKWGGQKCRRMASKKIYLLSRNPPSLMLYVLVVNAAK